MPNFEVEGSQDLEEFKKWAEGRGYSKISVMKWTKQINHLQELDIDIEEVTEEEIRNLFWEKSKLRRQLFLAAVRRYQEFLEEMNGKRNEKINKY